MPDSNTTRILISAGMIQAGKSGVGRYVIELVRNLQSLAGIEVCVAGLDADRSLFSCSDAHWISIPASAANAIPNLLWHQFRLPGICRSNRIDLLHIPSYRRILWSCPVPQVVTIHDCAPFILADKYDPLRRFFGTWLVPKMARRTAQVIAVSETTATDLRTYMQIAPDKLSVVLNGIDHEAYHPRRMEDTATFLAAKDQSAPFFLYVARIEHPGKNHIKLIDAFDQFKQRHPTAPTQLLLGGSDWHGATKVHERIACSEFRSDIKTLGFVPDEDLPHWYAAAEALVHPSLFEGFGLPVAEAMACGTIVLTAESGSLKEVAGDAAIYFDATDTADILRALETLTAMPEPERQMVRAKGIQWVQRYAWSKTAIQCREIYDRFLTPNPYSNPSLEPK